jgi:NAD(P)-dependent dehydrogenase (short-subunit alcohol dehydrogenase family)
LAIHLASKGIRVNGIAPGTIMTALQASTRDADDVEAIGVGKAPLHNRAGQPAEVGPSFVFLASSDANCMTGQIIHPNSEF